MKLAIQLYTLRDIIRDEETLADALLHLRQMGRFCFEQSRQ